VVKQPGNKTTRGWDEKRQITVLQREKEEAADYRYFPEPDIPPLRLDPKQIEKIKAEIPELPEEKIIRFMNQYGLSRDAAINLTRTNVRADEFEKKIDEAKKYGLSLQEIKINELASWIGGKKFNQKKKLKEIPVIFIVRAKKDYKLPKEKVIKTVNLIIDNNKKIVEQFKKGKETVIEFLVGQVMSQTKSQADPQEVRKVLREKLKSA
jgi:aspartyl-tRNA(Asn)/glutamyl-tRNA(Gln) amidotransferase subunit B